MAPPPERARMAHATQQLHESVDAGMRRRRRAFNPDGESIQLDLMGSQRMIEWQEEKARRSFLGESCWSELPTVYARYGSESARKLLDAVKTLERADAAVLTDSGVQACALLADVLVTPGTEVVVSRGTYNKTKCYLKRLAERQGGLVKLIDDGSLSAVERALTGDTRVVFVEIYSNPLTRAMDIAALTDVVSRAKGANPALRLVVDNTVATPWGVKKPLLETGVDFVVASGTKALDGRDQNMWGYIASRRHREMNDVMDLQAMRGGILDWRRSESIVSELDAARRRFEGRCRTASEVAKHLARHDRVSEVHHPSLPNHPDADIVRRDYRFHGSLLSFRLQDADDADTRHFCDVLTMTRVPRYALSFDGLVTKVNHHRSVSEYFATEEEVKALGVDRLVRLGIGLEEWRDLAACLDWALENYRNITEDHVLAWQRERLQELGIGSEEGRQR